MKQLNLKLTTLLGVFILLGTACKGNAGPTPAISPGTTGGENGSTDGTVENADEVVAAVNGVPITMETFLSELARFEAAQRALGIDPASQDGYQQQILDLLIEQALISQAASRQGITITEEMVTEEINSMIADRGEEFFNGWLEGNFYTMDEFREVIRIDLETRALIEPIIANVPTTAEHVHARHILVNSAEDAEEVLARLNAGEDFATLAGLYSVDVVTRDNGGDLSWFARGVLLVPEVEDVAFTLAPGQRSDIIQTAWGYHIIEVLEYDPAREVSPDARQLLIEDALDTWRISLRENADIQQFITLPL